MATTIHICFSFVPCWPWVVWGLKSGVQAEGAAQTWSTPFFWARGKSKTLVPATPPVSALLGCSRALLFPVGSHSCCKAAVQLTLIMEWGGGSGLCLRDSPKPAATGGAVQSSYREAANSQVPSSSKWQKEGQTARKQSLPLCT